jgi:NAD-dependent SIR2 family protein deacetylase
MTALPAPDDAPGRALDLLAGRRFLALTGAGMSTDSGIPDYRGPNSPSRLPMTFSEFVSGPEARQRYWARSHLGWSRMRRAEPNAGHRALAALHGRIADVICLGCGSRTSRAALHSRLGELNPGWADRHADVAVRPDGDVELSDTTGFTVPSCDVCHGVLKPDVVFFGENVPKPRVERCYAAVDALAPSADALLVLGSSLTVMSGFRFVRHAAKRGVPVVIVNRGGTRADELAAVTLHHGTTQFLELLSGDVAARGQQHPDAGEQRRVAEQQQAADPPREVVDEAAAG